jgi:hypothetical protein
MLMTTPFLIRAHSTRSWARCAAITIAIAASATLGKGQNQVVSVGFGPPWENLNTFYVAPGEIVTLFTTALGVPDAVATQIPLPTLLSGVSVLVRVIGATDATGYPASSPILRIHSETQSQLPDGLLCPSAPNV